MGFLSGLFGGRPKSSSSSKTTTNQTTNTQQTSLSNVVTDGAVVAGTDNTVINEFSPEVRGAFGDLVGLGEGAFDLIEGAFENIADLTGETIQSLESTNSRSIDAVIQANQQVQNPTYNALANTVNKTIPLLMFGVGAYALVKVTPAIVKGLRG